MEASSCIEPKIFVSQDLEEVTCIICQGILNHPAVLPCHHRFCRLCIESSLGFTPACPVCRRPSQRPDLRPDDGVWKIICGYKVHCPNPGCDWVGRYEDLASH